MNNHVFSKLIYLIIIALFSSINIYGQIKNPSNFFFKNRTNLLQSNKNVTVVGRWAYGECNSVFVDSCNSTGETFICYGNGSNLIISRLDSSSCLTTISEILLPGKVYDISISKNYAYIANGKYGLKIIDINNPEEPFECGSALTNLPAKKIKMTDSIVCVISDRELKAVNISIPDNPVQLGTYRVPSLDYDISDCAINDSTKYAYVLCGNKLKIIKVSSNEKPVEISYNILNFTPKCISIKGNYAYLGGDDIFYIMDLSTPEQPELLNSLNIGGSILDISLSCEHVYLACSRELIVLDISDLKNIQIIESGYSNNKIDFEYGKILGYKTYVYIASDKYGLMVLNLNDLDNIEEIYYKEMRKIEFSDIAVYENYAYVPYTKDGRAGYYVFYISDPENPGNIYIDGEFSPYPKSIFTSYKYLFINNISDVIIFDKILDPEHPIEINRIELSVPPEQICGNDSLLFGCSFSTIEIYDISDPNNPVFGSIITNIDCSGNISVDGQYLYVADAFEGYLYIYDISDISNPQKITEYRPESYLYLHNIFVYENRLYGGYSSFGIIDLKDKENPYVINTQNLSSSIEDIKLSDDYLYLSLHNSPLLFYDVSHPDNIIETGYFKPLSYDYRFTVNNGYIYLVDREGGLYILRNDLKYTRITEDKSGSALFYSLNQNYPNPFNSSTEITFYIPKAENVSLKIYDLLGREIKELLNDNISEGEHTLTWYGTNNSGVDAASGIYIYRVTSGKFSKSKKMVLLR